MYKGILVGEYQYERAKRLKPSSKKGKEISGNRLSIKILDWLFILLLLSESFERLVYKQSRAFQIERFKPRDLFDVSC